ncbi:hypothetical protein RNJ44_00736 [Nakaseomyces bracarensis]|uniref:Uncharacterized protein n=1 Tax=Nakaseomyces bracarensis TaxID=273131 RepID=A0ABR4NRY7_9SACH
MSSSDLILSYIADTSFSHLITKEEFEATLRNGNINPVPTDQLIDLWYKAYLRAEERKIAEDKEKLQVFLTTLRKTELKDLEKEQILESFNVEEIISALYKLDEFFNEKLEMRNKEIETRTEQINDFNNLLNKSTNGNEDSILYSITNSLQLIEKYRKMAKEKMDLQQENPM